MHLRWREVHHWWQRRTRGWDNSETWALDQSLARLILPRLELFKQLNNGYPYGTTAEAWDKIIDKMIEGFRFFAEGRHYAGSQKDFKRAMRGVALFAKHYPALWW